MHAIYIRTLKYIAGESAKPTRLFLSRADGHWWELIDRNSREVVYIINERIYHLYLRQLVVLLQHA